MKRQCFSFRKTDTCRDLPDDEYNVQTNINNIGYNVRQQSTISAIEVIRVHKTFGWFLFWIRFKNGKACFYCDPKFLWLQKHC